MKKMFLTTVSFLAIIIFSGASIESTWNLSPAKIPVFNCSQLQKDQKIHKEFTVQSGKLLNLELKTGASINVEGWDKNTVSVDAELGGKDWEEINLNFDQSSDGISVTSSFEGKSHNRNSNVVLNIKVPNKFNLKFKTMGGDVKLNKLDGELTGTTMGGSLTLTNLKGNLSLKTMGGPIMLTDSDVDGKVTTMGGTVDIQNVVGNVEGKSMGGNVTIKNLKKRDGSSTGKEVNISSMGGDIYVDTAPNGADVKTMGGNIIINSADKFVKANTMGGKILIGSVNGRVKAETMGGDVKVTETGVGSDHEIELKSMSGEITLILPADFSMNIEAEITYDKDDSGKYKIYSDFDLNQTKESNENGRFDNNETLTGTGSFNGGLNKVKISTVGGNIYIKKSN